MVKGILANRDLGKLACGNCGLWRMGVSECTIFQYKHNPQGPGCLSLISYFVDRGYVVSGESGEITDKDLRIAQIPKIPWTGLGQDSKIKLGLEFPLELAKEVSSLGDFNFALTKEVLKHPELAKVYKGFSTGPTYLDNSTNEEGFPCSMNEISKAAGIVNPTLVVAPDYLGNSEKTLAALAGCKEDFGNTVLPVIQGSSLDEVLNCGYSIRNRGYFRVAIPFDIVRGKLATVVSMSRTRSLVVAALVDLGFEEIHLLGLNSLEELALYKLNPGIKSRISSIDTGMPISLGLKGLQYPIEPVVKRAPTLRIMEKDTETQIDTLEMVYWNIAYLRKLL